LVRLSSVSKSECEVPNLAQPVVFRVVAKERRETLIFKHEAAVRSVRSHAHDSALVAFEHEVFYRLWRRRGTGAGA
jgi:hypothetical protein